MNSTDKIMYLDSKFWGLRNYPDWPKYEEDNKFYNQVLENRYNKALESCKSNKLEIVNPELIEILGIERKGLLAVNPGDIFDLPEGYGFKDAWEYGFEQYRFLRLVKLNSAHSFSEGSEFLAGQSTMMGFPTNYPLVPSDESQEKLWREAFDEIPNNGTTWLDYPKYMERLTSNFFIQRKKT